MKLRAESALFLAAFLRAVATGMIGVLLGIYLTKRGFAPADVGAVITAGLAGAAVAAVVATIAGDRLGGRLTLMMLAGVACAGGAALTAPLSMLALLSAAFLGMVNGMGKDRGAGLILDQAVLAGSVPDVERTRAIAIYNFLQEGGAALGALSAGLPALLRGLAGVDELTSLRLAVGVYAGIHLILVAVYRLLPRGDRPGRRDRTPLHPDSRRIVVRISMLFAVDGLAGGFLTSALLAYFFFERFGVSEAVIGILFFAARTANAFSHLGAAKLARRVGLVNTMVFTHIPSSLLLAAVPLAGGFPLAAALFLLRECLVEMDVPTRQSYVMAVVRPEERTVASGVTNLVRLAAWAVAPGLAGAIIQRGSLALPLYIAAAMKIAYDLLLYRAFRALRPPEERPAV